MGAKLGTRWDSAGWRRYFCVSYLDAGRLHSAK